MMQQVRFDDMAAFDALVAEGFCPWGDPLEVGADILAGFAAATGVPPAADHVVPGLFILSLAPRIIPQPVWTVTGHSGALNLGCPSIRFPTALSIGTTVRGRRQLASVRSHPRGTLLSLTFEASASDSDTPCLLAEVELLYLKGAVQ